MVEINVHFMSFCPQAGLARQRRACSRNLVGMHTMDEVGYAIPLIIGVTGHRDLIASEIPMLEENVERFFTDLQIRYPHLPVQVITALAEGADRLVARVALRMNLKVSVLLPMPRSVYETDFDEQSRAVFAEMLTEGDLIELQLLPDSLAQGVQRPGKARDAQYEYLGVYIAAHSHILLALWDGKPSSASGGTAHVIQFHQEDVVELLADDQRRSPIDFSEDESDLVYHVVCSREATGAPVDGIFPGECYWLSRDDLQPRTQSMPVRYSVVFDRQSEFNVDVKTVGSTDMPPIADSSAAPNSRLLEDIQQMFRRVDVLAIDYQRKAVMGLRWMYSFAALTGLSFIAYADFAGQDYGIFLYLLFLVCGISLYYRESRGAWDRKHLDYRGLAEGLRVQFFWALSGVPPDNASRFSHDAFMKRQDMEVGWIRNAMRYAGLRVNSTIDHATAAGLEIAVRVWVDHETASQTVYYRRGAKDRTERALRTRFFSSAAFAGAVVIAVVLALAGDSMSQGWQNILIALMGGLPFLAAVRNGYAHRVAERELIAQFNYMERIFSNARRLLGRARSMREKQDILRALGEAALDENGLWMLRQRERPLSGGELFRGG